MVKNESEKDIILFNYLTNNLDFGKKWETKKTRNKVISGILKETSKKNSGNRGEPDFIYINEQKKLLILLENKDSIKDHSSQDKDKPLHFAVDGILHYLSFFTCEKLTNKSKIVKSYLDGWKIIGLAVSGDVTDEYNHLISTFILKTEKDVSIIKDVENNNLLDEVDYISLFENIDLEEVVNKISISSSKINRLLRSMDSQKRPILLSALMICLFERTKINSFKTDFIKWDNEMILNNIPLTIRSLLSEEKIPSEKIETLVNELSFIKTDKTLKNTDILKDILEELSSNVIPLFSKKTNYDIIGKFYEEFLKYAGITNVKKGIVLTPNHITKLFTDLIDIKTNDIFFDPCCGTGAFLIAGMNVLLKNIENSRLQDKKNKSINVKRKQLIGFEINSTMFSLSVSNMLFRNDGKSQIHNVDFFLSEADKILKDLSTRPTIGFINPPYGGQDNKKNPTKKEIQFLEKMLDNVSRFGIMIAPLSAYFKDEIIRNRILSKHTLKYVINMPKELFQPNAATHTAIAVFETNIPHEGKKVTFYNLEDDGFILSKNKGRTDALNKWGDIEKELFEKIGHVDEHKDNIGLLETKISDDDEWIIQAHSDTDYSELTDKDFINNIKKQILFKIKQKLNLLDKEIDEITLMEILNENNISLKNKSQSKKHIKIKDLLGNEKTKWKEFYFKEGEDSIFEIQKGERLVTTERSNGDTPLVTASSKRNGIVEFIDLNAFRDTKKLNNNALTVDMFFNVFYHDYDYFSDDNVHTIKIKSKDLNPKLSIFIKTLLELNQKKYSFGRQLRLKRLEKESIILPVKEEGIIDWELIEKYVDSLPYSSSLI
ncbi:N-6 DNA methylase [Candidatus Pacearchaeota archaeon]|nr:N-6 DNA methylase [Candidatus Pacearchaeota archaeon]